MINAQPEIFYKVEGVLYRNSKFKENELILINKEFRRNKAQESRDKAFQYYFSLLDVLLESIDLKYCNKEQAEIELGTFYNSNKKEIHPKLSHVVFDNDLDKLITVSFCSTNLEPYITKKGIKIYDDENIIEAFGYDSHLLFEKISNNLKKECPFLI